MLSRIQNLPTSRLPALATFLSLTLLFSGVSSQSFAADSLQILPTRIVFEKQRTAELTLINKGDSRGRYRIFLRNMRTDDDGSFKVVDSPRDDELMADKLLRYSPRRVDIEPGSYQKVRVLLRKPKQLADGEYRTHMVFQTLPEQAPATTEDSSNVSIDVKPIVEISIPLIVRQGSLTANVGIDNIAINSESKSLSFTMNRQGSRSIYGDLTVWLESKRHSSPQQLLFTRGLSVYYPNPRRNITLPLDTSVIQAGDTIKVSFVEDSSYGGDQQAQASYPVAP